MRKLVPWVSVVCAVVLLFGLIAYRTGAQFGGPSPISRGLGVYNSQAYRDWGAYIAVGNTATGSQTITVCPWFVNLRDGRTFQPFASANGTFTPITVDTGSISEVVTPTATAILQPGSSVAVTGPNACASVTASFSNTHAASGSVLNVTSGDQGIQEAITDASLNNGWLAYWFIDPGIVTLATGAANTNLGSVNIPTRSVVMHASARVTTTIATCAGGWSLGFSTGTEFTAANTTLTAGTTSDSSTMTLPAIMSGSAAVPIAHCTTSNASAGAVHATFSGYKVVAPAQ